MVVVIIGLLAALALPLFNKVQIRSKAGVFSGELRAIVQLVEMYAMETGNYPPDGIAALHPVIEEYGKKSFNPQSSIGGRWDWDYNQFGVRAGLSLYVGDSASARKRDTIHRIMQDVDKIIDDGNLATGRFRQRNQGYIYIIEE